MNKKEAIANLNHIYGMVAPDIQRSIDVAIKCMEERPQGDLISREALKKAICFDEPISVDETWEQLYDAVVKAIDNAQAIPIPNNQIAWEQGYEAGKAQGKVEITEEQAINKLHETGWLIGHDKEMTTRPQGEWIKEDNGKTTDVYRCSICGRSMMLCKNVDLSKYPFCHCGAKMKGGAE